MEMYRAENETAPIRSRGRFLIAVGYLEDTVPSNIAHACINYKRFARCYLNEK